MNDDRKFVGELYSNSRWKNYFGEPTLFPFIGNLKAFETYATQKGWFSDVLRIFGKRISLAGLINELIDIPLLGNKDKKTLISEFLDIYEKHNANKTLVEWFTQELERAKKQNRYFTSISSHFATDRPLYGGSLTVLDSRFVIIGGAICHKDHLRLNGALHDALSQSACDWILTDFPPVGMSRENSEYKGEVVFIELDDGFSNVFEGTVPFCSDIGWFPYCNVAGFLNTRKISTEQFPTVKMSLLFQQRPVSPEPDIDRILSLLERETKNLIYLNSFNARVILYYLIPSMYKAWQISFEHLDQRVLQLLRPFVNNDEGLLNPELLTLYTEQIFVHENK